MKKVFVSVINDLSYDQRVHKVCSVLHGMNLEVTLIGRRLPDSAAIERAYTTKRMKLLFTNGFLFYATFNIRLFFLLLFSKQDILHANDLDTLLPNFLISKIKRIPLVYDTHEYFTEVPEVQNRKLVKKTWTSIEQWIFPRLKYIFTVNDSIASLYSRKYGKTINVLRNIPISKAIEKTKSRRELNIPEGKNSVILQGAGINMDRGAEELLEAVASLDNIFLIIAGHGDVIGPLIERSQQQDLQGKVLFTGKLSYLDMMQYTMNADLGVTLDKDTNLNYRFSLPNKLFDYVKGGIPVLASKLVEVEKVIHQYDLGVVIPSVDPNTIAKGLQAVLKKKHTGYYNDKLSQAAKQLSWETEVLPMKDTYQNFCDS